MATLRTAASVADAARTNSKKCFYDALNRFDYSNRTAGGSPAVNADVTLDAIGNISWKMGVGSYTYHSTQKRAVVSAGSFSFGYDANGNMTSRNGSSISYTSYNLPAVINAGAGTASTLSYGAFRNRYKQIAVTPTATETTIYVAGLLEKVTRGSSIEYRHLIHGGQGAAAIHTRVVGGASSTYYLHRDHLGSPELITDSSGNEVVRPSFGAYGERRDGTDWSGPPSTADLTDIANTSRRGFTGHEHLDAVNLIHMNGRVYEPVAGRFLGVDPILGIGISQDVNSYSYAWNNPLNVTDPSGLQDQDMTRRLCISCDTIPNYSFAGMDSFLAYADTMGWLDSREPTIEEKRSGEFFNPGDDVDVMPPNAVSDGQGFGGPGVMFGADSGCMSGTGSMCHTPFVLPEAVEKYFAWRQGNRDRTEALIDAAMSGNVEAQIELAMGFVGGTSGISRAVVGHSFEKHVLGVGARLDDPLFRGLGIRTTAQLASHVDQVLKNPTAIRSLRFGRIAYWHEATSSVLIHNPRFPSLSTIFQPSAGRAYFEGLR